MGIESILPLALQRRINRIVPIDDILAEETDKMELENEAIEKDQSSVSETTFALCIEPAAKPRPLASAKANWLDCFRCKTRKDRINWNSKLHHRATHFSQKTMYEQAENLMDIAATEFTDWVNQLSNDEKQKLNKETVKQLFSIGIEDDVSRSVCVQTIHRPVISQELADMFDCPELCIERNVRKMLAQNKKLANAPIKRHAFGRMLSPKSRRTQSIDISEHEPFEFPEDVRSGKYLFKGIDHLRSTRALVKHIEENNLPKPSYLVDMGAFDEDRNKNSTSTYVPLHSIAGE